jgi:UDP-N-acetylglucosamine 2-epimerase
LPLSPSKKRILTIVGARPQFIKAAAVSRQLRQVADELIVHTGQHYDDNMSRIFFDELGIPMPDYNLGIGSGSHGTQTGAMLAAIEDVLLKEMPDRVLVYGDTNSTLAGALAAAKLHIPVAHVEAGLRSFNRRMPEEINRVVTDHLADLLFCPSQPAVNNLAAEGITSGVYLVGDVMYEALMHAVTISKTESNILERLHLSAGEYILATIHRRTGPPPHTIPIAKPACRPRGRKSRRSAPAGPGRLSGYGPSGNRGKNYHDRFRGDSERSLLASCALRHPARGDGMG